MSTRPLLVIAALATVSVISIGLMGCSQGGGSSPSASPSASTQKSPLADLYSAININVDPHDALVSEGKVQKAIVACMSKQGFTYTPTTPVDFSEKDVPASVMNTAKWVAANGYGLVNTPQEEQAQIDATKKTLAANAARTAGMSQAEQGAYNTALYGPTMTYDQSLAIKKGTQPYDWHDFGCQGSAQHSVIGDPPSTDPQVKSLIDALGDLKTQEQADPRTVQLHTAWAACMADAGYAGLKDKPDAVALITTASDAYYNSIPQNTLDATKLTALRAKEIAIATADFTCSTTVHYDSITQQVTFAAEGQFSVDHRSEITTAIASLAQEK